MSDRTSGADAGREPVGDPPWLAAALTEQAERHDPDTARIRARTDQLIAERYQTTKGRRASRRPRSGRARLFPLPFPLPRPAGIPFGVLASVVSAAAAVTVALVLMAAFGTGAGTPLRPTNTITLRAAGASPSATAPGDSSGGPAAASATTVRQVIPTTANSTAQTSATGSTSATATAPSGYITADGALDSNTSSDWAGENVTVTLSHDVDALQITVKVSDSSSLTNTGTWTTLNPTDFDVTVNQVAGLMVYTFTLDSGQTVHAGTYEFGFQFNYSAVSHDFAADTYYASMVTTQAEGSEPASASGTF
jgi:hypothetical protein